MLLTNAEAVASVLRGTDGSGGYSPLAALGATRTLAVVIDDTMRSLVARARASGSTWQDIGSVLGTTRQAAFQRFGSNNSETEHAVETTMKDAGPRALSILGQYVNRDWTLRDEFDATMQDRLSEEMLAAGWRQLQAMVGAFKSFGGPTVRSMDAYVVVDVPMIFESGEMKGRVAFNSDAKIAGLFVLNPEVP